MIGFFGQALLYVLPFLLVLTTVVTIHELGHFLVARAFKVKIDRFSIGFGRPLFHRVDHQGVEWRVGWLPLGGYVKFSGDLDASSVPDQAGLAELRQRVIAEHGPHGLKLNTITRHMLGIVAGLPGAKQFRQTLSDARQLALGDPELLLRALP